MTERWAYSFLILTGLLTCLLFSCNNDPDHGKDCPEWIMTFDYSFGMDYNNPDSYLVPGEESELADSNMNTVNIALGQPENKIEYVLKLCHWVNKNFTFSNAGGTMAGVNTVDELFEIKTFYGCHSIALIISSILRKAGFPSIMIETVDVKWAYEFRDGRVEYLSGHVMSEIYVADHWILLDNNGTYVDNYDYMNPYISVQYHPTYAYFVFAKGIDIWDYSNRQEDFTEEKLFFFSENITCYEDMLGTVSYNWKSN